MVTYYGPTVMAGISQLHRLEENYKRHIQDLLFHPSDTYEFQPYTQWSEGYPDWADPNNTGEINANKLNTEGWRWLQGEGINSGKLYGGCIEVLEMLKGTRFFCDVEFFNDKILFLENAEGTTTVEHIRRTIRSYGMQGMLERIQALLIGRARDYSDQEKQQLDDAIISVVRMNFKTIRCRSSQMLILVTQIRCSSCLWEFVLRSTVTRSESGWWSLVCCKSECQARSRKVAYSNDFSNHY